MGFWQKRGKEKEKRADRFSAVQERAETLSAADDLLRALTEPISITTETALEIPALSASVDFIAQTVAMMPVKLFREDAAAGTTDEVTEDKRLFLLNDEANSVMGADTAKAALVRDALLHGSGFLYIQQDNFGDVAGLYYVKHGDVSVLSNCQPIFKDFNILVGGRRYYPWNFVVLARNSEDGITGKGVIDEHKTLLSAMYETMRYEAANARTGGNKKGFLESERVLTQEAMDKLKQAWRNLYANNEDNMMILNNGIKYVPSASTSAEMQLNESKKTNADQITQIFRLSPAVISGACTTAEYMAAVRTAVLPVAKQLQAALNRSLLREDEKRDMYFALDTTELLRGDTLQRYQAYEIALRNNFLQLDEVRYMEDKKPLNFNFLKLGLDDVLLDTRTNTVYTPNMNAVQKLGSADVQEKETGQNDNNE